MTTRIGDWDQSSGRLYSPDEDFGGFLTGEGWILFATPVPYWNIRPGQIQSVYSNADIFLDAVPLAIAQDFSMGLQKNAMRVYELGSSGKYTISSNRIESGGSLSQAIFNGPTLLKTLYQNVVWDDERASRPARDIAGYDDFIINLGSSLFNRPIGLIGVAETNQRKKLGAIFIEEVVIPSLQFGISAQQPMVVTGLSFMFGAVIPIPVRADAEEFRGKI